MSAVDLDVIVVNFNTAHLLDRMFETLHAASAGLSLNITVVDNASSDHSVKHMQSRWPEVRLIQNSTNVGFGRANNQALSHLQGRHTLLLNTDAFVAPDCVRTALAYLDQHPRVGIVGVRLIGRDGSLQPSCRYFPTPLNIFLNRTGLSRLLPFVRLVDDMAWDHQSARPCDWVPGCFYLVRREVIEQLGLFDSRYFMYYEEVDHCKRAKAAGWEVHYLGTTSCIHLGGESAATVSEVSAKGRQISALQVESELLYMRKHHGVAGLAAHLVLGWLGDCLLAAKQLLKGRGLAAALSEFGNSRLFLRIGGLTSWGSRPTR
ncbi:MAG: glycosyltransferase family 2 protein [Burkholderiales bacterium]